MSEQGVQLLEPAAEGLRTERSASGSLPLREILRRCLRPDLADTHRLSYANTSVSFRVSGDGEPVTVHLDRYPPAIAEPGEPAEIDIELAPEQAERFARGALPMPGAVAAGHVITNGPIRKYLEVDPILRRLLACANGGGPVSVADRDPAAVGDRPNGNGLGADLLAIETRDLHKSFGAHHVLAGVDLAIPEGVISVVLGPSGTGKSVLLKHIIGLLRPDAGDVLIRGRPLSRMSRTEVLALRTEIGVMFQDGALFSAMNVYDNVAFPLRQHTDLGENEIREVVMEHLNGVGLGGALVMDPGIVLCDEPDSGLDPVRTALLGDLLVDQHGRSGGTMVVITHDVALAKRISDHISVLWRGKVLEAGMAQAILGSDTEFVRQFLAGETVGPLGMDA
jgi:phospholipid/cholesterol/gamma-HCH transport system ATP-binding protein